MFKLKKRKFSSVVLIILISATEVFSTLYAPFSDWIIICNPCGGGIGVVHYYKIIGTENWDSGTYGEGTPCIMLSGTYPYDQKAEVLWMSCNGITNYYENTPNLTNAGATYYPDFTNVQGYVWFYQTNIYAAKGVVSNNFLFPIRFEISAGTNILKQDVLQPGETFEYDYSMQSPYPGDLKVKTSPTFGNASDYPGVFGESILPWTTNATPSLQGTRTSDFLTSYVGTNTIIKETNYTFLTTNGQGVSVGIYKDSMGNTYTNVEGFGLPGVFGSGTNVMITNSFDWKSAATNFDYFKDFFVGKTGLYTNINSEMQIGINNVSNLVNSVVQSDVTNLVSGLPSVGAIDTNIFSVDIPILGSSKVLKLALPISSVHFQKLFNFIYAILEICVLVGYYAFMLYNLYLFVTDMFKLSIPGVPKLSVAGFEFGAVVGKVLFVVVVGLLGFWIQRLSTYFVPVITAYALQTFSSIVSNDVMWQQIWSVFCSVIPIFDILYYFLAAISFYGVMVVCYSCYSLIMYAIFIG